MNICIIDECIDRVGGVERVINTLANKLSETNNIKIISEMKSRETPFYKYNDNVEIKYLNEKQLKSFKLQSKNLLFYINRVFEKLNYNFFTKRKIKNICKDLQNYDVIVFGRIFSALHFLKYMDKKKSQKIIVRDAINLMYYSYKTKKGIKKLFAGKVDCLIVSSDESKKMYSDFLNNIKINIKKIYNPIGIEPNIGYKFDSNTIISIGRLDIQKGYDNLINAFSLIAKKYPNWCLKIYGDGTEKTNLINLINKLKLERQVKLLPSTKNVVSVFNNSSIFVLSSRYEGYANILVEALACGIPSISYNWLTGVEEIISDNNNGLVVNLKNREDYFHNKNNNDDIINLSNTISRLIESKKLCDKLSKCSIKITESRNIELIIREWINVIEINS